jgi:hypothetical protein
MQLSRHRQHVHALHAAGVCANETVLHEEVIRAVRRDNAFVTTHISLA